MSADRDMEEAGYAIETLPELWATRTRPGDILRALRRQVPVQRPASVHPAFAILSA